MLWLPWTLGTSPPSSNSLYHEQVGLSILLGVRTRPSVAESKLIQLFNKHLLSTCYKAGAVEGIWNTVDKKPCPTQDILTGNSAQVNMGHLRWC